MYCICAGAIVFSRSMLPPPLKATSSLWQTLILSGWNPLFAWMPVETLVHHNQALYYKALQDSHTGAVDCRPFIAFMLDAIANSLYKYIDVATETVVDVGVNVGVSDRILELLVR